ncbi:uncharacterized protein LOC141655423 [Silene latifolia]|uniref:uncharacterized protein LOC141655423 n=1 Tax=Silene latifolia TaxID=37657 RepID=UPI003D784E99
MEGMTEEAMRDVKEWVECRWKEMSEVERARMMVGCWAIWEHRNKVIFDEVVVEPEAVVRRAIDVIEEGIGSEEGMKVGGPRRSARSVGEGENGEGWRPAREGVVKINVDARVKEEEGVATGIVCRNHRGEVVWGVTMAREQLWDVHIAEAIAILDGMEKALRRGEACVEMESDCLEVVEALKQGKQGRSIFSQVIEDILVLSSNFQFISWLHTSRVNNSVAHALAHVVPRVVGCTRWEVDLPPSANAAALFDRSLI